MALSCVQSMSQSEFVLNNQRRTKIKFQLIDEFIEKSPKILPINKTDEVKPTHSTTVSSTEYSDLMTETLAQIYTEQKMFDKAIKAYKILGLKYPEKKDFFANKIQQIEEQRNS